MFDGTRLSPVDGKQWPLPYPTTTPTHTTLAFGRMDGKVAKSWGRGGLANLGLAGFSVLFWITYRETPLSHKRLSP